MKRTILIKGGHVIDPVNDIDRLADVLIVDGFVVGVGEAGKVKSAVRRIDATGLLVLPGLIDMHVHLREPGFEDDETIETGRRAAAAGGFTAVACMPNTEPPLDTQASLEFIRQRASGPGVHVYPVAAVTKGRQSRELTDFELLSAAGAVAFSDDGAPVSPTELMQKAMQRLKQLEKTLISHCEILELSKGGVFNKGPASSRFGLRGIPAESEWQMVRRDVELARATGCALHIAHASTLESVEIIETAKTEGAAVSAEATPHHVALCDEDIPRPDANFKMNPPLRAPNDVAALRQALKRGIIDAIASDHAPHGPAKKSRPIDEAPFGVIGLETSLAVVSTELVHSGLMSWNQIVERMSIAPARILGVVGGSLSIGAPADVSIVDPEREWTIDAQKFYSKSRNTCFDGKKVRGRAVLTIIDGEVVYDSRGEARSAPEE